MRADVTAATAVLARAGVETPRVDAEWLLAGLLGTGRAALVLELDRTLDGDTARRYAAARAARARPDRSRS